ncbi:M15 family metallopeptidase [Radiobacillus sp. PE A8.2]|uniref:M15 family metallopeptidase n=1 Tax=Radiobacillus sp. PE A8.2 TaxID=3380349 RepID=UPI0038903963
MRRLHVDYKDIYKGDLILVNRKFPIQDQILHEQMQLMPVDRKHEYILLERKTANMLAQLLQSIDGATEIVPVSGYRSYAEQEKLYNDSLVEHGSVFTKQYIAYPGCSEHQTGMAIDLAEHAKTIDFIRPNFPYSGICGIFRQHAAQYGFIERYGKEKVAITGIAHEPWHFRYVGYPHATVMQEHDLCLEEYIEFIKNYQYEENHYVIKQADKQLEIFYVKADSKITRIVVPTENFQISGNNVDGFIVTIWRHSV